MKPTIVLFITSLLIIFSPACLEGGQFFKLEKTAVSSLPGNLVVPGLKSLCIDPSGNVFAFAGKPNGQECFIVKFNEKLEYLKHFGRDGNGPGEFKTRNSSLKKRISIDTNGDVYVVDYNPRRLVIFDNDGNYKKDILIARNYSKSLGRIHSIKAVGSGTFIALQYRNKLPTEGIIFTLNPPAIKVRHSFNEKDIRFDYSSYVSSCYGENCIIDTDSKHIVFGNSQIFKFCVYDREGNLKLEKEDKNRIMRSFTGEEMDHITAVSFTSKPGDSPFMKNYLDQLRANRSLYNKILRAIKNSKNVIADIKIADENIYVFLVGEDISVQDKHPVEVYNLNGRLIKEGYFNEIPAKIYKNHAYFYGSDEKTDDPVILKYKILF
jgi:hypothetical protein